MDGRECTQIYTLWKIHCSGDTWEDSPWNQGNENTALNLEDVIENVIGIETVVRVASFQNSTVEMDLWGKTKQKLCLRVKIILVILLWSFM